MNHSTIDIHSYIPILEEHQEAFRLFEKLLVEENKKYNLTRITSSEQVQARHFLDSLAGLGILDSLSKQLKQPLRIIDAGSGAGFPGLVLAIVRPQWQIVLLEATEKKVRFQKLICDALHLDNVQPVHGRAEEVAHQKQFREMFDVITARALAQMQILAELSFAFIKKNGLALFWKGSGVTEEITQASSAVKQMGGVIDNLASYPVPEDDGETVDFSLIVCRKVHPTPKQYPRAFGVIKKAPLGSGN